VLTGGADNRSSRHAGDIGRRSEYSAAIVVREYGSMIGIEHPAVAAGELSEGVMESVQHDLAESGESTIATYPGPGGVSAA
jgi:hypothetical protein